MVHHGRRLTRTMLMCLLLARASFLAVGIQSLRGADLCSYCTAKAHHTWQPICDAYSKASKASPNSMHSYYLIECRHQRQDAIARCEMDCKREL
mmetsp:Transcript_1718/g.4412  ORF Transcript_1718/g.4412 Transcript_1718/m.4412 type:complete len:94 (+) Transcript_1718:66-347(+)